MRVFLAVLYFLWRKEAHIQLWKYSCIWLQEAAPDPSEGMTSHRIYASYSFQKSEKLGILSAPSLGALKYETVDLYKVRISVTRQTAQAQMAASNREVVREDHIFRILFRQNSVFCFGT